MVNVLGSHDQASWQKHHDEQRAVPASMTCSINEEIKAINAHKRPAMLVVLAGNSWSFSSPSPTDNEENESNLLVYHSSRNHGANHPERLQPGGSGVRHNPRDQSIRTTSYTT